MTQKILLIQLRQLGDIILTTPMISAIKKALPKSHVAFLSHPMGRVILKGQPDLDEHIVWAEDVSWRDQIKAVQQLRAQKFDVAIDFMNNPRSALLCFLSGAKRRIAFRSSRSFFYNELVEPQRSGLYLPKEKALLLQKLLPDHTFGDLQPICPFDPQDLAIAQDWLSRFDRTRPRIIISATSRREDRRWPLERYAALADFCVKSFNAVVIWIWGPGEKPVVEQCQKLCSSQTYISWQTQFREMVALMSEADFFIGNSNGPSHVAVARNIPSLQIHGYSEPESWCPLNEMHRALGGRQPIENVTLEQAMEKMGTLEKRGTPDLLTK